MTRILFFGQLREQLQCEQVDIELAEVLTVDALKSHLLSLHPHWQPLTESSLLCAVNQTLCQSGAMVKNGDEVAFFPPVTGG